MARQASLHSNDCKMAALSSESCINLVLVLTAHTQSTVSDAIDINCQTERVTGVTIGRKRKFSYKVNKVLAHEEHAIF